jgi:hypothetical protein
MEKQVMPFYNIELLINSCADFKQLCFVGTVPHAANRPGGSVTRLWRSAPLTFTCRNKVKASHPTWLDGSLFPINIRSGAPLKQYSRIALYPRFCNGSKVIIVRCIVFRAIANRPFSTYSCTHFATRNSLACEILPFQFRFLSVAKSWIRFLIFRFFV